MFNTPPGYTLLKPEPGLRMLVRQGLEQLAERHGLTGFPTAVRSGSEHPGPAAGRTATRRMEFGDNGPLVVKTYRRGGLLGRFRGDGYRGVSRPLEEIRVCEAAQSAGVRVPLIQCLWIQRIGPGRYRLAAATREIPDALDLFRALGDCSHSPEQRQQLLSATADEIRKLHLAGIHHPDLNLGNILVSWVGGIDPQIHLIDFDRAVLRRQLLDTGERHKALTRMYRSLVKLSLPERPLLTVDEKELFLARYWPDHSGSHRALRRRCHRELLLHRLWWRFKPPTRNP